MTDHDHSERTPGCFRCEMTSDEIGVAMTVLDDWCTTCRTHRAPKPGGQCPICAPTPDDLLERIDATLAAEDQAPAGRHQVEAVNELHASVDTIYADLGLTRQENPR
jgi:hypothetical protein